MKVEGIEYVKETYRVPSKSRYGAFHKVGVTNKGNLWCDCTAGKYGRKCSHIKMVDLVRKGETVYLT